MKGGRGESTHRQTLHLFFVSTQKVYLFMRVPSWWTVVYGRSDSCTCWRGCIGGAVFGGAIEGFAIVFDANLGSAIVDSAIVGGTIVGKTIIDGAIAFGAV